MNSRLNNVGSGVTLFISAWPVYAVFVAFVTATGWTSLPAGLLLWFTIIYALTVSTRGVLVTHWCCNPLMFRLMHKGPLVDWRGALDNHDHLEPWPGSRVSVKGQMANQTLTRELIRLFAHLSTAHTVCPFTRPLSI